MSRLLALSPIQSPPALHVSINSNDSFGSPARVLEGISLLAYFILAVASLVKLFCFKASASEEPAAATARDEQQRADEDKRRAEVDEDRRRVDEDRNRADEDRRRADEDRRRADEDRRHADEDRRRLGELSRQNRGREMQQPPTNKQSRGESSEIQPAAPDTDTGTPIVKQSAETDSVKDTETPTMKQSAKTDSGGAKTKCGKRCVEMKCIVLNVDQVVDLTSAAGQINPLIQLPSAF